jgi:transposase
MTDTKLVDEVLKTDGLGRVKTPKERREALLDEFERGGMSGTKFAEFVGVKYQTFASWRQKRRRQRGVVGTTQRVSSNQNVIGVNS